MVSSDCESAPYNQSGSAFAYDLPNGRGSTNVAREEIQVGSWITIEAPDAAVLDGSVVLGPGVSTEAVVTLQNPRGDGVDTLVSYSLCFDRSQFQVFDQTTGHEILSGQSLTAVVPGCYGGSGESYGLVITITSPPGASGGGGGIGVGGGGSGVAPGPDPLPGCPNDCCCDPIAESLPGLLRKSRIHSVST